jgi:DNA polymerase-3 subunit delta'
MTKDELFRYQPELIRLLTNAYQKNKLVHAYLFEGNEGTGLKELAEYFSMLLLCENEEKHPCYKCNSCKRVLDHTHTNLIWIEPSNDAISKDKIESLIHEFSMTSLEGGNQISIIMDADKLNSSASNALLKFLEEPKDNHYAILITTNKNRILPTIVSRAQVLHFKPLSEEHTISCLKA